MVVPFYVDDFIAKKLDFNTQLIRHPAATFYARMSSDSMRGAGLFRGDLMIIDRSLHPQLGDVIVIVKDGEMVVRHFTANEARLMQELEVIGVVIASIRQHRKVSSREAV